ncbi:hypothetical protein GCM10029963_78430 [Micromonospora andamanensis]
MATLDADGSVGEYFAINLRKIRERRAPWRRAGASGSKISADSCTRGDDAGRLDEDRGRARKLRGTLAIKPEDIEVWIELDARQRRRGGRLTRGGHH